MRLLRSVFFYIIFFFSTIILGISAIAGSFVSRVLACCDRQDVGECKPLGSRSKGYRYRS